MFPRSLSAIRPRSFLLTGVIGAVAFLSIKSAMEYKEIRAAEREFRGEVLAYDRCAADVRKSGKFGDLLDLGIDAMCPPKPSHHAVESLVEAAKQSRTADMHLAGLIVTLASLPWLASLWVAARVRPPSRA